MRSIAITVLSASLAALASAFTKPVGDTPSGNPIYKPNLGDIVPKGQPYNITWGPTSSGTITLLLLRGPSENVVPLKPIAEGIPNTGSYVWTPDSSLEPDTSRYGIQLIQDSDGAFQYSTQFGIGGDSVDAASISSTTTATNTMTATNTTLPSDTTLPTDTTFTSATTLPLPTTTFFRYYNGSCHACPPHNQTTTVSNTETQLDAQPTASASTTALFSAAPVPVTSTSLRTTGSAPTTAPNSTVPIPATGAAGQMVIPFGSAAIGLVGMFVALLI